METSDRVDDIIKHYGVLGMKWGVRKDQRGPKKVNPVVTKSTPGRKVQTSGGEGHSPSADAKRAAAAKRKAAKSTTDSLTNKELKDLVERMNLEQQYNKLSQGSKSKGEQFVRSQLEQFSKQMLSQLVQQQLSGGLTKLIEMALKKAK